MAFLISVLFGVFATAVAVQYVYAMLFSGMFAALQRVLSKKISYHEAVEEFPVSVIICTKNEVRNLQENLPVVLSQRYTNSEGWQAFEVIVVNDGSTDGSAELLHSLSIHHENLRIIHLDEEAPRTLPGKKFPLSHGIAAARYKHLLLTDADCQPTSEFWLEMMTAPLRQGRTFSLGYSGYRIRRGLLNAFIRWETLHTWLQYSAYAQAGRPYMGVGRNLACTRGALERAQALPLWRELPSGDDDLLITTQANGRNTIVVDRPNAFTVTDAKNSWNEWRVQKQRHLSTGKYYAGSTKALLGTYGLSHGVMWLCFILLMCTGQWEVSLLLMILRCTLYWALWFRTARQVGQRKLVRWFVVCDLGWAFYNLFFSPYLLWKNKQQWTSS